MNLDSYDLDTKPDFLNFEFFSEGPKGRIKKIIQFRKVIALDFPDPIYNLGFGDFNEEEGRIDDLVVSNNEDSEKVLATVAAAVALFADNHPGALVFAQGSTSSRTRFYVMGISKYLREITSSFEIWGSLNTVEWELFSKNRPYKALLARRK